MPPTRRSVLASTGLAAAALAGCSALDDTRAPAGSLQFVNDHHLPHSLRLRVTDVGTRPGDEQNGVAGDPIVEPGQRDLVASVALEPGASKTYEGAFTDPVWYAVEFTVDGSVPERGGHTIFNPAPEDREQARFLGGRVDRSGEFTWVVSATRDFGDFD